MVGNLGNKKDDFVKETEKILNFIEKSKGFKIKKCPKCGSDAYCEQTATVGGFIVQKADREGYIHQSEGAHENCIKWKCEKCGYILGD